MIDRKPSPWEALQNRFANKGKTSDQVKLPNAAPLPWRAGSKRGATSAVQSIPPKKTSLWHEIHMTLNHFNYSPLASVLSSFIMATIIVSTLSMIFESMDHSYWAMAAMIPWDMINLFAYIVFTIEYFLRLVVHEGSRLAFVTESMNVIDLLAILPFLIEGAVYAGELVGHTTEISANSLRVLRIARLFRLVRLLKLAKYSSDLQVVTESLYRSRASLQTLAFLLAMNIIIFSSLMYEVEQGVWDDKAQAKLRSDGEPSPFKSIPHTFWWGVVTMTTVGYGDLYPVEAVGKMIGAIAMVVGILVIALPVTIIGTNFQEVWSEDQKSKAVQAGGDKDLDSLARAMEEHLSAIDATMSSVDKLFTAASAKASPAFGLRIPNSKPASASAAVKTQLEVQSLLVKQSVETYCKVLRLSSVDASLQQL